MSRGGFGGAGRLGARVSHPMRRVFTIASVLSLLLFGATLAVWVRSYFDIDSFRWVHSHFGADEGFAFFSWGSSRHAPRLRHIIYHPPAEPPEFRLWSPDFEFADWKINARFLAIALDRENITLVVPCWSIVLFSALIPAWEIARSWRAKRRRESGPPHPYCGFDVRAGG